jgi:hypothetical protein
MGDAKSFLGDAKSSLGDAKSSLGDAKSSLGELRARWVTLRARWMTSRARWVTLRARWVTLRARWVTLRARWVTLRARWVFTNRGSEHTLNSSKNPSWLSPCPYSSPGHSTYVRSLPRLSSSAQSAAVETGLFVFPSASRQMRKWLLLNDAGSSCAWYVVGGIQGCVG